MAPTLISGDHILVNKWFGKKEGLKRGEIIVFSYSGDDSRKFIARVIGLPGEILEIKKQKVYINDSEIVEPYAYHTELVKEEPFFPRDDLKPLRISEGFLFVLGDNRENSNDSRFKGFIEIQKVVGIVKLIYWSIDGETNQIRWNRVGKWVE